MDIQVKVLQNTLILLYQRKKYLQHLYSVDYFKGRYDQYREFSVEYCNIIEAEQVIFDIVKRLKRSKK